MGPGWRRWRGPTRAPGHWPPGRRHGRRRGGTAHRGTAVRRSTASASASLHSTFFPSAFSPIISACSCRKEHKPITDSERAPHFCVLLHILGSIEPPFISLDNSLPPASFDRSRRVLPV
eukprot:scaffold26866_cov122-Isochrysis_galbana.AAC.3